MSPEDPHLGVVKADVARAELYDTLSQLRDRLNFAERIDNRVDRARRRIAAEQLENPVRYALGVAAVAATIGVTVWGVARVVMRKSGR